MNPGELALVLGSALLHAVWSVAIKRSRDPLVFNALQLLAPVGACLLLAPWMSLSAIPPPVWAFLGAAGIAHGLYFYWMSRAFEHGDLTLVYPIARSTPAFLPLLAVPLFGETISRFGGVGIATVVAGMWLVHTGGRIEWSSFTGRAARYAYLTLLGTIAYSLIDKGAMAEFSAAPWTGPLPRVIVYSLILNVSCGAVFVPLVLSRRGVRPLRDAGFAEFLKATAATTVSFIGYAMILKALETAAVSYVVAVRQMSVLFALLLGISWLGERPGIRRAIGALLTVAGVALIALAP